SERDLSVGAVRPKPPGRPWPESLFQTDQSGRPPGRRKQLATEVVGALELAAINLGEALAKARAGPRTHVPWLPARAASIATILTPSPIDVPLRRLPERDRGVDTKTVTNASEDDDRTTGRFGAVRSRWYGALAGVAAAVVAIGAAEPVAVLTGSRSAPLVAVGGAVVDTAPEPLKRFAIDVFGRYDKIALLVGTAVLLGAFAALIGVLALRRIAVGYLGIALFTAIGVAAASTRPDAGPTAALPTLLGAVLAAGALWLLIAGPLEPPIGRSRSGSAGEPAQVRPGAFPGEFETQRRRFLTGVGAALGGAAVAGVTGRWLATRRGVAEARARVVLPQPVSPAPPVPGGADLGLPQLARYTTPNFGFYRIDTAPLGPQIDPE